MKEGVRKGLPEEKYMGKLDGKIALVTGGSSDPA
jgi:hypothetical protein